ncbi:MAG: class I SAM-dependent methyltransferase, partial [Blastocatellia bacterium]
MRRAVHQMLDIPPVFKDEVALSIVGPESAPELTRGGRYDAPGTQYLRAFLAARSRYAEDELARAVERGVRRYVILGAGFDTFAYRNPYAEYGLRVFEVDHPTTQAWKRAQLDHCGISIPDSVTFVPVDFERQTLD